MIDATMGIFREALNILSSWWMISEAVTVPPGVLIRSTTAFTFSSCVALVSCSLTLAMRLGVGMSPSPSWELITPDISTSKTFAFPVPLTCVSCRGPGPGKSGKLKVQPAVNSPISNATTSRLRMMFLHKSDKFLEQIRGIMRPRGCLRMVLD